jgi:cytochrome c-type biogenesis protein CcmE
MDVPAFEVERRRRERLTRLTFRVAAAVAVGVPAGWLLWAIVTAPPSEHYAYVDEVTRNPGIWRKKALLVHGCVAERSLERDRNAPSVYRFVMRPSTRGDRPIDTSARLRVTYEGTLPPAFDEGAEIVLKGRLVSDGVLAAAPDSVMTKCPSKFDGDPRQDCR